MSKDSISAKIEVPKKYADDLLKKRIIEKETIKVIKSLLLLVDDENKWPTKMKRLVKETNKMMSEKPTNKILNKQEYLRLQSRYTVSSLFFKFP
jgi:hypothetical protein